MRSQPEAGSVAVDVVVVAYNSREHLRAAVEPLVHIPWIRVIVVDNASPEGGLETVADLPVTRIQLDANVGFGAGCNVGWRRGAAPYVLFLNPDAEIDRSSIRVLVEALEHTRDAGLVGPKIADPSGSLYHSQRRFPRLRSTYAVALFLHRALPRASWTDELVRDPDAYAAARPCEWISGACMLVRRELLEEIEGFDERFFLYCEDLDLCKRVWDAGYEVRFEPRARCVHEGGASAPRAALTPVAASSRFLYARKHARGPQVALEWLGLVLNALTHSIVSRSGAVERAGHLRSLSALARLTAAGEPRAA